eukprot:5502974-Alexandrium_andersonii.AAC.1
MAPERQEAIACGSAPEPSCPVPGGGDDPRGVGGEGSRQDAIGVPPESALAVPGGGVPDLGGPVGRGRHELAAVL